MMEAEILKGLFLLKNWKNNFGGSGRLIEEEQKARRFQGTGELITGNQKKNE